MSALFTVADLLQWANTGQAPQAPPSTQVSAVAQQIVDGISQAIYWATGRTPPMLSQETEFTETYSGTGSESMYVRNAPILSVTSLVVNGVTIPASLAYGQAGFFVQDDGKSIAMRSGGTVGYLPNFFWGWGGNQYKFLRGRGNVVLTYTAGYAETPPDLYLLCLKQGAVFLQKRLREDEASHGIPSTGQTAYRAWAMQPEVRAMLQPYTRTAMVNVF